MIKEKTSKQATIIFFMLHGICLLKKTVRAVAVLPPTADAGSLGVRSLKHLDICWAPVGMANYSILCSQPSLKISRR